MPFTNIYFSFLETYSFLKDIRTIFNQFTFNPEKHVFSLISDVGKLDCDIKVPPLMGIILDKKIMSLEQIMKHPPFLPDTLILLIQAGHAALGISQNGTLNQHKIIRKYMVRKGQGKAQIYYIRRKGKARGGAKLRLARTREFFIEINRKLLEWDTKISQVKLILVHCSIRLWSGLLNTAPSPPFTKLDSRIRKIPINTYRPSFKELKRVHSTLLQGYIAIKADKKITTITDAISLLLESTS